MSVKRNVIVPDGRSAPVEESLVILARVGFNLLLEGLDSSTNQFTHEEFVLARFHRLYASGGISVPLSVPFRCNSIQLTTLPSSWSRQCPTL